MRLFAPNIIVSGATRFIRTGRPGSRPNTEAEATRFENAIMALRDKITAVRFGRRFLDLVGNNSQPIMIVPVDGLDNASTEAARGTDATSADFATTLADGTIAFGSGRGSVTAIFFNPDGTFRGVGADRTLVHELTHAYRQARGRWKPESMTSLVTGLPNPATVALQFPNWEEWFGVVVEGVWASEAGATSVRTSQQSGLFAKSAFQPSAPSAFNPNPVNPSEAFSQRFSRAITRINIEERQLYDAMRSSSGWFNPVRSFHDWMFGSRF